MLTKLRATANTISDARDMVAEARTGLAGVDAAADEITADIAKTTADLRYTLAVTRDVVMATGSYVAMFCTVAAGVIIARYLTEAWKSAR